MVPYFALFSFVQNPLGLILKLRNLLVAVRPSVVEISGCEFESRGVMFLPLSFTSVRSHKEMLVCS